MNLRQMILSISVLTLSAAGCNSAVSGDYKGDPQFTVKGLISGTAPVGAVSPSLGVAWYRYASSGDSVAGEVLPITSTSFPAQFDFDLLSLPPDSVLNDFRDSSGALTAQFALGFLVVFDDVDGDGSFTPDDNAQPTAPDKPLGFATNDVLLYTKTAPTSAFDPQTSIFTDFTQLKAGYQIAQGVCGSAGSTFDKLSVVGADTQVSVTLGSGVEPDCLNVF